MTQQNAAPA